MTNQRLTGLEIKVDDMLDEGLMVPKKKFAHTSIIYFCAFVKSAQCLDQNNSLLFYLEFNPLIHLSCNNSLYILQSHSYFSQFSDVCESATKWKRKCLC